MDRQKVVLYISVAVFGIVGVYFTFISIITNNKYDSQTVAYDIYERTESGTDDTIYYPTYYFKVNGKEYECDSIRGSSSPNGNKNKVYYDSNNPEKCMTEYDKSSNLFIGIVCLIITGILVYFFIIRKGEPLVIGENKLEEMDKETQEQIAQQSIEVVSKIMLIVKRIILGIVILILLILVLFETAIFRQTIKARNYIETVAVYRNDIYGDDIYNDYVYVFEDNSGNTHKIVMDYSEFNSFRNGIKIKYNKDNPEDYYKEGMYFNKTQIIWYVVKIIGLVLLIVLFFNKKLLSKINISMG